MTDDLTATTDMLSRWQQGDPRAAGELFERYAQRLTRLAEQHLSRRVAGRIDGEDVVQSVFRTFFRRSAGGEFHIDHASELWRLLARITLMKARAKGRHHTAQKRDVRAETPLPSGEEPSAWWLEPLARDPDPADAVAVVNLIEFLLRDRPAVFASVLEMRLQGESVVDVARQLGVSRKVVYTILQQFQRQLEGSLPADPA
jgi:RNA polymerase sigma-70 factor (ECF subfamily)